MNEKPFVVLPIKNGVELIPVEDIISVCSEDKTSNFTMVGGKKGTHNISIGKVEKLLNHAFLVRCHLRYIVNIYKIKEVLSGSTDVILVEGTQIPVSRSYRMQFRQALADFCIKLEE